MRRTLEVAGIALFAGWGVACSSGEIVLGTSGAGSGSSATPGLSDSSFPSDKFVPKPTGLCPTLSTGFNTFKGQSVQTFVGKPTTEQHGALVLYWHATGNSSSEVVRGFGRAQIDAVTAEGGMVASFTTSLETGTNTGNYVWYTDDFKTADEVVGCAIQQLHIDTRRIYSAGADTGALQGTWMSYARSGYIAAAASISGGLLGYGAPIGPDPGHMPQDPSNIAAGFAAHGAPGLDLLVIDYAMASARWEDDIQKKGGFSVDCNNGGGHMETLGLVGPAIWEFFKAHPFKTKVDPYESGVPADFPKFCVNGPPVADGPTP